MRKLLLVGLILIGLSSCTPEDECGKITDYGWELIGNDGFGNPTDEVYFVELNGNRHYVRYSTFIEARIGDVICIEY